MPNKAHRKAQQQKQQKKNVLIWGAAALVVFAVIGWIIASGNSNTSSSLPSEISVFEALARKDAGAFILDVRQPEEWNEAHIPDATLIPLDQLTARLNEVPKDRQIVVVCRTGHRSATGRDLLLQSGFTQVTSMAGGLNQWKAAGYPTVSGP